MDSYSLFLFVLNLTGFGCMIVGARIWLLAEASRRWPRVSGRVIASSFEVRHDSEFGDRFTPVVRYAYMVGGQRYTGTRIGFGDNSANSAEPVQALVAKYPAAATVDVIVDPARPEHAVLESTSAGSAWWFFFGLALVLAPLIIALS